jgi:hypothetical protein
MDIVLIVWKFNFQSFIFEMIMLLWIMHIVISYLLLL